MRAWDGMVVVQVAAMNQYFFEGSMWLFVGVIALRMIYLSARNSPPVVSASPKPAIVMLAAVGETELLLP